MLYVIDSVLVDVDLYNMNISIDAIRKQLHPKQSGSTCSLRSCQYGSFYVMAIAKEHNLYVIEITHSH
jgi:dTDP-4-amino-4,6-dideoxygalactose transaminase